MNVDGIAILLMVSLWSANMRISTDIEDPGYQVDSWKYCICRNGQLLNNYITADTDIGMCIVCRSGNDGMLVMENGNVIKDILYGVVTITKRVL